MKFIEIIMTVFTFLFIGNKNKKYLNKDILKMLLMFFLINIIGDYLRGRIESINDVGSFIIIYIMIVLIFFRFFVFVYESVQKFWVKVLN